MLLLPELFVDDSNTTGIENGSREHPYRTIQAAIDRSAEGGVVRVAEGTYREEVTIYYQSVKLYGGYPGGTDYAAGPGDFDEMHRDWAAHVTTIDGEESRRCLTLEVAHGEISGFHITRGAAATGGGIQCARGSDPAIERCKIFGNSATEQGGGLCCLDDSAPAIARTLIVRNWAGQRGGGLCCLGGATPALRNVTVAGNSSGGEGGGLCAQPGSSPSLASCILWANSAPRGRQLALLGDPGSPASLSVAFSDVQRGEDNVALDPACTLAWGVGNLDADPQFADPAGDDYHLKSRTGRYKHATGWLKDRSHSPCIDSGDPSTPSAAESPPNGDRANMGAYGGTGEASMSDGLPVVAVEASDPEASEIGPDTAEFTVTRTGDTTADLTVAYSLGGSAKNGVDYEKLSGSLTLPAGAASATILVVPLDDDLVEKPETVVVTLRRSKTYLRDNKDRKATATIEDKTTVSIAASDPEASEEGLDPGEFTVSRTGSAAAPLTVYYSVKDTASPDKDYVRLPGSLVIPAGAASATIAVSPLADTLPEPPESVIVTLKTNKLYSVEKASSTATVTIADDEPAVSVAATDPQAAEPGGDQGQFTISRTRGLAAPLTVYYKVGGKARKGHDCVALPGSLVIPAGAASATVAVVPLDDTVIEPDETVILTLVTDRARSYRVDPDAKAATVTIADDDTAAKPQIAVAATDPIASEGGWKSATFTLTRTGSTAAPLTVFYRMSGKASNGKDYEKLSGKATFPAGSASLDISVIPRSDSRAESDEPVILTLKPSKTYSIDPAQQSATVTLLDND